MDILKKHIYIAGPYTAKTEIELLRNIELAEQTASEVFHRGHIPITPHIIGFSLSCDERHTNHSHEHWTQNLCLPLLSRCDAVLFVGDWQQSRGCIIEHEYAQKIGMPIYLRIEEI